MVYQPLTHLIPATTSPRPGPIYGTLASYKGTPNIYGAKQADQNGNDNYSERGPRLSALSNKNLPSDSTLSWRQLQER